MPCVPPPPKKKANMFFASKSGGFKLEEEKREEQANDGEGEGGIDAWHQCPYRYIFACII